MSVARSRELIVPIAALAAVVVLSAIAAVLSPPSSGFASGSSFSKDADGSAAAYLTLQSIGYRMRRSFEPLATVDASPFDSVIVLADPREPASEQDRRALQAFVAAGGTVLVTGCLGESFLSAPAAADLASVAPGPRSGDLERGLRPALPSPLTRGVPRIAMSAPCAPPRLDPQYVTLYANDRVEAVKAARLGRGLAVWWAGNTPIENEGINADGHLELLLNVAGPRNRTIVWDEFYHGQRRSLWSYARATPLPWAAAQIALAAFVAAAMYVRRRVPVRERYVEPRTSPLEFADAMAALYGRAGSAREAVMTARARLRRLLVEATGLSAAAADDRLAAATAARFPVDADALRSALEASGRAESSPKMSPDAALPLVRQLQTLGTSIDRRGG
jgi:hypothetical protein